jgi:predicted amidohydrolase
MMPLPLLVYLGIDAHASAILDVEKARAAAREREVGMARFAAVQMESIPLAPQENMQHVLDWMEKAAQEKADVAVFPECILTGYMLTPEEAERIAEPVPGPRTQELARACRASGLLVAVGTLERDAQGDIYNVALLVGPEGVLGLYRKSHLPYLGVDRYVAAGDSLGRHFDTPRGRLGLLVCYDIRFPEPARILALGGAQVVLLPTAWPATATLYPDFILQARAAENGIFIVAANRAGAERGAAFLGRSIIAGPNGEVLAEQGGTGEGMLLAELDPGRSDEKRRIFAPGQYELDPMGDRRPELYGALCAERDPFPMEDG